jgi:hypothetical protein
VQDGLLPLQQAARQGPVWAGLVIGPLLSLFRLSFKAKSHQVCHAACRVCVCVCVPRAACCVCVCGRAVLIPPVLDHAACAGSCPCPAQKSSMFAGESPSGPLPPPLRSPSGFCEHPTSVPTHLPTTSSLHRALWRATEFLPRLRPTLLLLLHSRSAGQGHPKGQRGLSVVLTVLCDQRGR